MKNFVINFLAVLGAVFLGLLLVFAYFFVADPYELKPLLFGTEADSASVREGKAVESELNANTTVTPLELTEQQKEAVSAVGVDPESIPDTISTEQEACFVGILGSERVLEIKGGAVPSVIEFARVKECL